MEVLQTLLPLVGQVFGGAVGAIVVLVLITRFIPNDKLYNVGYKIGVALGAYGSVRVGRGWNALETFMIKSFGQLLAGIRDGLQSDNESATPPD